jgi:hypothetical protein
MASSGILTTARSATITTAHLVLLTALSVMAAGSPVPGDELLRHLSGVWKAAELRTPRGTALDEQVFGPGAVDVRNVTLVAGSAGEGDLQVHTWVAGRGNRRYAPAVIEVKLRIGEPVVSEANRIQPTVSVTGAEERYLDGSREHWRREGVRVSLTLASPSSTELSVQLETQDGRDAFGATLTRRP